MPSAHLLMVLLLSWGTARAHQQPDGARLVIGAEVLMDFQPDKYKTYLYTATNNSKPSLIVTACSAPIEWNVFESAVGVNSTSILLHSSTTAERETYAFPQKSEMQYTIKLKMNRNGYGSIILTNTTYHHNKKANHHKLLQMKWKSEHDLVMRWHKHNKKSSAQLEKNYCVVISTGHPNSNLCSTLSLDEYKHLRNTTTKQFAASFIENYKSSKDQLVYCTNTNLLKLNVNQLLDPSRNDTENVKRVTANLFVFEHTAEYNIPQHVASNETFPVLPTVTLKENKLAYIKVDKVPVTLSLKVLPSSFANTMLDVYVVPCDARALFNVDITFNGNQLATRQDIIAFGKVSVPNVQLKKPYAITVSPRRDLNATGSVLKGVQVFASTLSGEFNSFPEMPRRPAVKEYRTLRTCRSVTVGWIPPNGLRMATYCLVVKMGKVNPRAFQGNQCNMKGQLRRGRVTRTDVAKMCKQMKHTARISVLTQKIDKLSPGKFYTVQILVRKPKGRMLSYETLQVRTKSHC